MMGILRILIGVLWFAPFSYALTPSAAQIEAFKSLSPVEQKALAKQYGVSLPVPPGPTVQRVSTPEVVHPRQNFGDTAIQETAAQATDKINLKEKKQDLATNQKLEQFGYDLFAGLPTTFAPATDIPVPVDYIIGPGDVVMVQLYGKENATHELVVNREGVIQFPEIGPVTVAGQTFQELKSYLSNAVSRQMIGVKASITMGALRSIRIFVLGEAFRPGSYTVSALSTMTNALFYSGGIKKIGSLRNIQLKRKGRIVGKLDLYDLLLDGDTSQDQRLQPGDVIFIPAIGKTIGVSGAVKRPAIYEIKDELTAAKVVTMAGQYLPSAYPSESRIERISAAGSRTIVDVDLTTMVGKNTAVRNGDVLNVYSILDKMDGVVLLSGYVHRPGGFSWEPKMKVTDIISSYSDLLPNADLRYAIIKRESLPERKISIKKVELGKALALPGSAFNISLHSRDELVVFGAERDRSDALKGIITQLKSQRNYYHPENVVSVKGNVRFPSEYPYHEGMDIRDLIDAASGLDDSTDFGYALLVREQPRDAKVSVEQINLARQLEGGQKLKPGDELLIFSIDEGRKDQLEPVITRLRAQADRERTFNIVNVSGFVRFPGNYPLTKGMTVKSLIAAAGGYQEGAYTLGAEITRSLVSADKIQSFKRVDVDLVGGVASLLEPRDQLYVKKIPNWAERETATVSGEVMFPGTYPIFKGDTIVELVERAGGLTEYGDPGAAVFMRDDLRRREQQQILKFKAQLEKDLAELELEADNDRTKKQDAAVVGETMLGRLAEVKATGRLVIELQKLLGGDFEQEVKLRDKDLLVIPRKATEVSVIGEVQFPTSHLFESGLDVFDYIEVSGGFTAKSDDGRIYVIKPNGKIISVKNGWFVDRNTGIGPGDTVVVPYDTDAVSPMVYWSSVSQILFQLATTVAALETVGVFN